MSKVKKIFAYQIIASGGRPTIEAKLILDNNQEVVAQVGSDEIVEKYQAEEVRDGDSAHYDGMGVSRAVDYINNLIGPKLVGVSPLKLAEVDGWLHNTDNTENKSKLGINTILAISTLFAKAGAKETGMSLYSYINSLYNAKHPEVKVALEKLPSPIIPLLSGKIKESLGVDFKEFQIVSSSSLSFERSLEIGVQISLSLKEMFNQSKILTNIDAMEVISAAIIRSNHKIGQEVFFSINFDATRYVKNGRYQVKDRQQPLKSEDYIDFLIELDKKYLPLVLIDPVASSDWETWKVLSAKLSKEIYLVGNNLICSNAKLMQKAITEKFCSTFIIKTSQVGTISEIFELIALARKNGLNFIMSSSDYETNDSFISDLAVGLQVDLVTFGKPTYGENLSKYNRMVVIEKEIQALKLKK